MKRGTKGALLAAAVAGLFFTGQAMAGGGSAGDAAKVKCEGANACKGHGACKGAKNACAGKNACKGQGWTHEASKEECTKKGGKVVS